MAYGKTVKSTFKDCVVKKVARGATGGNITAEKGSGLPVVVGISGLKGKSSGLKP